MKRILLFAMILLLPQVATARMYMCVDESTGETTFTDRACEAASSGEEIRVNPINSGEQGKQRGGKRKVWRSDAESRKTGTEYNSKHRSLYENDASVQAH